MEEIVKGIDAFQEAFSPYSNAFIVIGGSACRAVLQDGIVRPRRTKDIDMVLAVQELNHDFIGRFWKFIQDGGYKFASRKNKVGDVRYVFYSFVGGKEGFPEQIELLSRPDDSIGAPSDHHIAYIETDDDYSHLSAIILDRDYYEYLSNHYQVVDGIRYASADALICLKALAYVNLLQEKQFGKHVNEDDIKKHRRDVLLAVSSLPVDARFEVNPGIWEMLNAFLDSISDTITRQSLKASLSIDDSSLDGLLEILRGSFITTEA